MRLELYVRLIAPETPEELVLEKERRKLLREAICRLETPDLELLAWWLEGLTYKQIGERAGRTKGSVEARLGRIRYKISQSLNPTPSHQERSMAFDEERDFYALYDRKRELRFAGKIRAKWLLDEYREALDARDRTQPRILMSPDMWRDYWRERRILDEWPNWSSYDAE